MIRRLKPLLWAFVAWFVVNTIVRLPGIGEPFEAFWVHFTTISAYWFGKIFFLPVDMPQVPYLTVNGFAMEVVMTCTAYTFYLFALALIVFSRWPLKHKLTSLATIVPGIFILNNLRFISMGYLGSYRPEYFEVVHDIIWNVLFGFIVFGLWAWRELSAERSLQQVKATLST